MFLCCVRVAVLATTVQAELEKKASGGSCDSAVREAVAIALLV